MFKVFLILSLLSGVGQAAAFKCSIDSGNYLVVWQSPKHTNLTFPLMKFFNKESKDKLRELAGFLPTRVEITGIPNSQCRAVTEWTGGCTIREEFPITFSDSSGGQKYHSTALAGTYLAVRVNNGNAFEHDNSLGRVELMIKLPGGGFSSYSPLFYFDENCSFGQ